jgi:hypothetical protein
MIIVSGLRKTSLDCVAETQHKSALQYSGWARADCYGKVDFGWITVLTRGGLRVRGLFGALCVTIAVLTSSMCSAATIQPIQGVVSINHGQGFQKIYGVGVAKEGDSVMVSPDGSATVSYADGCNVKLEPGMVMTITALSPCASGSYAQDQQNDLFNNHGAWIAFGMLAGMTGFITYEILHTNQGPPPASP